MLAVWRQFNSEFGTAVAAAPDGLRLRSGLMPDHRRDHPPRAGPGRAYRRAADLAGVRVVQARGGRGRAAPAPGEPLGGAAPARADPGRVARGRRADARRTADRAASAGPAARPDARAGRRRCRITSWRWDGDDHYVVASRGRVCRKTTWVPLEKVQSIRWVQGPSSAARPRVGAARRGRQAGDRQHPGPRRRRGRADPGPAARPGPRRAAGQQRGPRCGQPRVMARTTPGFPHATTAMISASSSARSRGGPSPARSSR